MNLEEKVISIIAEKLSMEPSKIMLESTFVDDLKADSLDRVELIMAFEDAFNIQIPDEVADKIKSVKDAIDYLKKVVGK